MTTTDSTTPLPPKMPPPWRVEGRVTPFHAWVILSDHHCLDDACAEAKAKLRSHRYYRTRVRAN